MNYERDEECSAVCGVMGGANCNCSGCRGGYEAMATPSMPAFDPRAAYWSAPASCDEVDYRQTEARYAAATLPDTKLKYEFIVHQTDKAILFALKGEHGIYQQWIPRSVITAQTDKKVSVKSWFAKRLV